MPRKTVLRLAQRIKERAAHLILHELSDPRVGFVTVTRVNLSDDLSLCQVYYSVMGSAGDVSRTRHALEDARGYLQRRIAEALHTRTAPHVDLLYDESVEGSLRMTELLRDLAEERRGRDPEAPPPEGPEEA